MDIKKILEYQSKDREVIKLERQLEENQDRKIYMGMISVVKDAQSSSASLEKSAEELVREFNNLKKIYEENTKLLNNLENKNLDESTVDSVKDLKGIAAKLSSNLNYLEKKIMAVADNVKKVLDDFDNTKRRYASAKAKHAEHKQKYEETCQKIEPEISRIKSELKTLENGIDPQILAKYKLKRADKFFPIFVPLRNNSCGGCMMEQSTATIEKIKKQGTLECENCHRIMFVD